MLSAAEVRDARPLRQARKLFDGRGLYLLVAPNGGRYWRYNYRFQGKFNTLALGIYPDVTLAKARRRHQAARCQLADGIDPSLRKRVLKDFDQQRQLTNRGVVRANRSADGETQSLRGPRSIVLNVSLDVSTIAVISSGDMKTAEVINALGALAHEYRLAIYRLLVEQGPEGLSAGAIGEKVGLVPSSLTFHLQSLHRAGLITQLRASRQLIYSADYAVMTELVGYLTDKCCAASGETCATECKPVRVTKTARRRNAA